ncbi:PREDICTED: estradiol 17-beta-dehydrogenase 8-like [Branchiostoma belcheri]|uniref:Estradiol 17-beta-dehydrogenase 8-like n=1 Tax=Branchiostoma belcheri TaxID=7741 RepID=A0A6P5A6S2_BRABE|nr:PREDICTED: estradiol 17-beta-dehydrogenase 8-like [Branchiostoma belcheri]
MADKSGEAVGLGRLTGRIAVVTGGSGGIGGAICQLFAREGASVAVVGTNEDKGQEMVASLPNMGSQQHRFYKTDVTSSKSINAMATALKTDYPSAPSVVVTCAGVAIPSCFLDMDEETYDKTTNVNQKGTFLVAQAMARLMVEDKVKNGSIITMGSICGRVGQDNFTHYSGTKGAVVSMTRGIAKELAEYGIRCNVVVPTVIETNIVDKSLEKARAEYVEQKTFLKRAGKPSEVANLCLFLASDESSYMTGQVVDITGGQ